jgi:CheY-like chemotaxis protein
MNTPSAKVLLVHPDVALSRLVKETLEAFCDCQVEATSASLAGYERALQREYRLYVFALKMEPLDGGLLYELISTAHQHAQGGRATPAIIFLCDASDSARQEHLLRDARVKGLLLTPPKIGQLLEKVNGILPTKVGLLGSQFGP